jgi:hypothetical protein
MQNKGFRMKRWVPKAMVFHCLAAHSVYIAAARKRPASSTSSATPRQEIQEDFVQVRLKKQIMLHVYHLQLPNYSDTSLFEGEKEKNGEYHLEEIGINWGHFSL